MEPLFRWIGVLFLLFLILRVSLARRGKSFGLGAGVTLLNLLAGALLGLDLAAWSAAARAARGAGAAPPAAIAPGDPFLAAMISILPIAGATIGGLAGYLGLGALWRRLSATLPAAMIVRLRRIQVGVCVALAVAWIAIRMGTFTR
jgi:hypothetical protein